MKIKHSVQTTIKQLLIKKITENQPILRTEECHTEFGKKIAPYFCLPMNGG